MRSILILRVKAVAGLALGLSVVTSLVTSVACFTPKVSQRTLVSASESEEKTSGIIFHDVRVFTASDAGVLEHQDVVVKGRFIKSIAPTSPIESAPDGMRVVEGAGQTLLPGFIDSHTHVTSSGAAVWSRLDANPQHNLEAWLYAGVTTIYDLGGFSSDIKPLIVAMNDGQFVGPRVFFTDLSGTGPGGHPIAIAQAMTPWPLSALIPFLVPQLESKEDAKKFVDDTIATESHYIKLIYDRIPRDSPRMDADVLKMAITEAHARDKKVFVHIGTAAEAVTACEAGADVIAHGPYRSKVTPAQAQTLASKRCPIIYTLVGWQSLYRMSRLEYAPTTLAREISPVEVLGPVTGDGPKAATPHRDIDDLSLTVQEFHDVWHDNIETLRAAGVTFLIGSDAPLPGVYPGSSFHEELERLAAAGISPTDLLLGATSRAAHILDDNPAFGEVAVGKIADLVVVNGDPTVDIRVTTEITAVVRDGVWIERHRPQLAKGPR